MSGFAIGKTIERTGKKSGANIISGFATGKTTERTGKKSGVNAVSGFAAGRTTEQRTTQGMEFFIPSLKEK